MGRFKGCQRFILATHISNGRHPLFRVWKGPGPLDDSDEERAAANRISTQTLMQLVDEGVHVGQLLEDLFPSANVEQVGMEEVALNLNSGEDGVGGQFAKLLRIVQNVAFSFCKHQIDVLHLNLGKYIGTLIWKTT